jgi:hypothetical protein
MDVERIYMRSRSKERLGDNLSLRISREMRDFLDRLSEEHNVAIGEAARMCIDRTMRGIE